jgi:hypothetical protein
MKKKMLAVSLAVALIVAIGLFVVAATKVEPVYGDDGKELAGPFKPGQTKYENVEVLKDK